MFPITQMVNGITQRGRTLKEVVQRVWVDRTDTGFAICAKKKRLVSDFSMWQMKHGDTSSYGRRLCDVHMAAQDKEKQRMRDTNQAMMTISRDGISATQPVLNLSVNMLCPVHSDSCRSYPLVP
jgi:hypothetical protein